MFKVIVASGRYFNDYKLLSEKLDFILRNKVDRSKPNNGIQIVSGTAKGADTLGEQYAKSKGYSIKEFPPNWRFHGKKAGYLRNKKMRDYADACIVFWDGKSKGTKLMIDLSKEVDLPLRIIHY